MTTETLVPFAEAVERYEPVFGLETHVELGTTTKMFCGCLTAFGAEPNTHVCPVCLGLPGALPVINRRAVEHVLATGVAIGAETPPATRWDRKNYFYPDLNPSSMSGNSMFYASASKTLLFYVSALGNPMLQTLTLNLTIGHKP